ncbi:uncharacterized protein ACBT44_009997 [Syngnathus typhle]
MSSSKEKEWSVERFFRRLWFYGHLIRERLIRNASRIYGASAGALMAASSKTPKLTVSYWLPDVLYRVAGGFYKSLYKKYDVEDEEDHERLVPRTERCSSLPKHLRADRDETTPTSGPTSNEMDTYVPLTPPPPPTLKPELRDIMRSEELIRIQ